MIPAAFRLRASPHAAPQLRAVTGLLRERRFRSVVNACDAGREGELIFRYVYRFAGGGPPVQRLWISSLTDEAIRRGFAALRPGEMKFSGYSLNKGQIPGVQAAKSWSGLVMTWKRDLAQLASDFAAGEARVDPKKALATCRQCDLQPLCRVHEKLSALEDEEGDA